MGAHPSESLAFVEDPGDVLQRIAARNSSPRSELTGLTFWAFGHMEGGEAGRLKVTPGPEACEADLGEAYYRAKWAAARGYSWDALPAWMRAEFEEAYLERACAREAARARVWENVMRQARINISQGRYARVYAFLATSRGVFTLEPGDSPGVDQVVAELERERVDMRRAIDEAVR